MGDKFFNLLYWTVIAAIVVAIVLHADGVAGLINSFGSFWVNETTTLTGANATGGVATGQSSGFRIMANRGA